VRLGVIAVGIDDGPSGTRTRLEGLLPALRELRPDLEVVVYGPRGGRRPFLPGERRVEMPFRPGGTLGRALRPGAWRRLRGDGIDVALADYHPVLADPPTAVTIHDLRALAGFGPALRRLWTRHRLPGLLRRAAAVIVPSRTVSGAVRRHLGVADDRVAVVPNAPGGDLGPDGPVEDRGGPYVLHVGPDVPRKDLDALRRSPVPVVLVGRPPLRDAAPFVPLGEVSRERLAALLRGAMALVLPGRAEGSGLPALEAMACGTPVIAARAGALPETCGDAARLVEPGDAEAWRGAIEGLVADPDERQTRSRRALERVAGASWVGSARKLLDRLLSISS
jgi:glycosyltransferase involved in cell wall biosynthesis